MRRIVQRLTSSVDGVAGVVGACVVGACVVGACVVGACLVGACATTSPAGADLAGKPHVAHKLASVPQLSEVLGGCSIDSGGVRHAGRRVFDCGDYVLETEQAPPSPLPPPAYERNRYAEAQMSVEDVVDVDAGGGAAPYAIARARKHVPALYELAVPLRTIRCSAGAHNATADVEEKCLAAIVAFAASLNTEPVEVSADSRPAPAPLPPECKPLDGGKRAHGVAGARCNDVLLTWRQIGHDDIDVAADAADAPYLSGVRDLARNRDQQTCAVAGQLGLCTRTEFAGGAILHGVASVDGQRLLVTCVWYGGGRAPEPCLALIQPR